MTSIQELLAISDFSADAGNGIARATRIAADQGARLRLLHVLDGPLLASLQEVAGPAVDAAHALRSAAADALDEIASEITRTHGVAVATSVTIGSVLDEIVGAAQSADVLVMGAHGTNPLRDAILGTTAERLLGRLRSPSLVVKQACVGPYNRVVVPVDFSTCSPAVLAVAMRIAPEAEIHVLHAYQVPFEGRLRLTGVPDGTVHTYREQARLRALANIMTLVKQAEGPGARRLVPAVEHGDVTRVLLQKASDCDADLIALGRQGRNAVEEFLLGSVTRHVLADSRCDVLVVSEKRAIAE